MNQHRQMYLLTWMLLFFIMVSTTPSGQVHVSEPSTPIKYGLNVVPAASPLLYNPYFELQGTGGGITELRIDPSGTGSFGTSQDILGGYLAIGAWDGKAMHHGVASSEIPASSTTMVCNVSFDNAIYAGFTSQVNITLAGPEIRLHARVDITDPATILDGDWLGFVIEVPFEREGYDASIATTPFARLFSNTLDYVPIEQFKRMPFNIGMMENYYSWLVASGQPALGYDLNFTAFGWRVMFDIQDETLGLFFHGTGNVNTGISMHFERDLVIRVQLPGPEVPEQYPRFSTSNATFTSLLNRMFLERSFGWPWYWCQADWMDWSGTIHDWMGSTWASDLGKNYMLNVPLEPDGHVYTWYWGGSAYSPGWPFPDNDSVADNINSYDTRHYTTNPALILGAYRYYSWFKDTTFLSTIYPKLHAAMQFMLQNMSDWNWLFVQTADAHSGLGLITNAMSGRRESRGVGSNYWDILPFGYKDAYTNAYIHGALHAMTEIEAARGNSSGASYLAGIASLHEHAYNVAFWNETRGRYIGCIDVDGDEHDHGFTFLNLEVMYHGLANQTQVIRIYDWMENEPTATGKRDTYTAFQFAPRATTDANENWWYADMAEFGGQVQDGGAILYTSGFDIRDRARYLGADDAMNRFQAIMARYAMPDKLTGGSPRSTGETAQQLYAGAVGTDIPFPESGLVPQAFMESILGITANTTHLRIEPDLPTSLSSAGLRGIHVGNAIIEVNASESAVVVRLLSGSATLAFTIACGNISFSVADLVANGTLFFNNHADSTRSSAAIAMAKNVKDAAISAGRVFWINGTNMTSWLEAKLAAAVGANASGDSALATTCARALASLAAFLLENTTLHIVNATIQGLSQLEVDIASKLLLSPEAWKSRDLALREISFAMDARARGAAGWVVVHDNRATEAWMQALSRESHDFPLLLNVDVIAPIWFIMIAAIGLFIFRHRSRLPGC